MNPTADKRGIQAQRRKRNPGGLALDEGLGRKRFV